MRSVYVATASAEWRGAREWMDRLLRAGIAIPNDWTKNVERHAINGTRDIDLPVEDQLGFVRLAMQAIERVTIFWFLAPEQESFGCWVELGFAMRHSLTIITSGPCRSSFQLVADRSFQTHEEAFHWITKKP
jgi:hypothetical protein